MELARRWLRAYGPAPVTDLRWWTGWTAGQTKKALSVVEPAEVDLDGVPGVALPDDVAPVPAPPPWVAFLPALDPTPMGWQDRDWFLGPHRAALFDRSGNIGPTIWLAGRVVGGWAQRASGEIVFRLLEDVGAEAKVDGRGGGGPMCRLVRRGPGDTPVPDPAGAGAGRVSRRWIGRVIDLTPRLAEPFGTRSGPAFAEDPLNRSRGSRGSPSPLSRHPPLPGRTGEPPVSPVRRGPGVGQVNKTPFAAPAS